MIRISTQEAFEEACRIIGRGLHDVIFLAPTQVNADFYQSEFVQRLAAGAMRNVCKGRVDLSNGRAVRFLSNGRGEDGLRGYRAVLFRAIGHSRDETNRYRWDLDDTWPGHPREPAPTPRTRFERIDGNLV